MKNLLNLLICSCIAAGLSAKAIRPNVVFLVSEDNSIHYLRLYGNELGKTPAIEKLAAEGLTFNHAFSNAPVCSVARSTLATGILAPRVGIQYHRKTATANLPKGLKPWSGILRDNGYFCTNIRKTDYNFVANIKELWDKPGGKNSPWGGRKDDKTPFFHMQSFGSSHESSLHFPASLMKKEKTSTPVEQVDLHPYHPDTPTFRYTHARYFDRMTVIDNQVGAVVEKLRKDGLLEDTFVFYFGDHGGVLPRGKGYAYESGLHVPLVVRIPENFRHLVDHERGTRTDGFVSFIDFGPTVLHLAGIEVPKVLDGTPFLGKDISAENLEKRDEAFGYADRFDEKYDFVRTLRKGRYTYLRNYQAFYPDSLHNFYRYRMLAFAEWRTLYNAGKLNKAQSQFFERRPAEQLFDVEKDPHEVNNLADDPKYRAVLLDMRQRMTKKVKGINDLSFYPESHMVKEALGNGIAYGEKHSMEIGRLIDIANLGLAPLKNARKGLLKAMKSENPHERYWGCITSAILGERNPVLVKQATAMLDDNNLMVRVRAAEFLGSIKALDPMPTLYSVLNTATTEQELTLAFNTVVYLRDHKGYAYDPSKVKLKTNKGLVARRTEYLNK